MKSRTTTIFSFDAESVGHFRRERVERCALHRLRLLRARNWNRNEREERGEQTSLSKTNQHVRELSTELKWRGLRLRR